MITGWTSRGMEEVRRGSRAAAVGILFSGVFCRPAEWHEHMCVLEDGFKSPGGGGGGGGRMISRMIIISTYLCM